MASRSEGFSASRFPVRDDDRRPLRYRIAVAAVAALPAAAVAAPSAHRRRAPTSRATGRCWSRATTPATSTPWSSAATSRARCSRWPSASCTSRRAVAWFLAGCNCIPVDRGGADRRAVTRALDVLRRRGRLLIFVEGTRSRDGTMQRAEAGRRVPGAPQRRHGPPVALSTDAAQARPCCAAAEIVLRYGVPFELELGGPPRRRGHRRRDRRARRGAAARRAARRVRRRRRHVRAWHACHDR